MLRYYLRSTSLRWWAVFDVGLHKRIPTTKIIIIVVIIIIVIIIIVIVFFVVAIYVHKVSSLNL